MKLKLDKGTLKLYKKIFSSLTMINSLYTLSGVIIFCHEPSFSSSIFLGTSALLTGTTSYALVKTNKKLKKI